MTQPSDRVREGAYTASITLPSGTVVAVNADSIRLACAMLERRASTQLSYEQSDRDITERYHELGIEPISLDTDNTSAQGQTKGTTT